MSYDIIHSESTEYLKTLPDNSYDGCLCDPPYGWGFMSKKWDASTPDAALWREVYRVLKPGAYLMAFGGPRTYHRMVFAIEDACFEIRDCLTWLFGSGMPKSKNLGNGYGTGLKPSCELICLARKPIDGTLAENAEAWGTGGLNIKDCRIGEVKDHNGVPGRWPANTILDEEAGAMLDAQSGDRPGMSGGGKHRADYGGGMFGGIDGNDAHIRGDSGGASRFFYSAKVSKTEREAGCESLPIRSPSELLDREPDSEGLDNPRAGAGRSGNGVRNTHTTLKPIALTTYLAKLILPPAGGRLICPFGGAGSECIGALLAGWTHVTAIEMTEEYIPILTARLAHWTKPPKQGALF